MSGELVALLRVMHAAQLLSPHRAPQGQPCVHDGTITTSEPDVMWGTDGMRVETVEDGGVWIFVAVEHWNAEGVTINNLLPGAFATERTNALGSDRAKVSAIIPAGRFGDPSEFGDTCAFLCGVSAAYITGQNILIDGGWTAGYMI